MFREEREIFVMPDVSFKNTFCFKVPLLASLETVVDQRPKRPTTKKNPTLNHGCPKYFSVKPQVKPTL